MKFVINELCNLKGKQCIITGRGKEETSTQSDLSEAERGQEGEAKRSRGRDGHRRETRSKRRDSNRLMGQSVCIYMYVRVQ